MSSPITVAFFSVSLKITPPDVTAVAKETARAIHDSARSNRNYQNALRLSTVAVRQHQESLNADSRILDKLERKAEHVLEIPNELTLSRKANAATSTGGFGNRTILGMRKELAEMQALSHCVVI